MDFRPPGPALSWFGFTRNFHTRPRPPGPARPLRCERSSHIRHCGNQQLPRLRPRNSRPGPPKPRPAVSSSEPHLLPTFPTVRFAPPHPTLIISPLGFSELRFHRRPHGLPRAHGAAANRARVPLLALPALRRGSQPALRPSSRQGRHGAPSPPRRRGGRLPNRATGAGLAPRATSRRPMTATGLLRPRVGRGSRGGERGGSPKSESGSRGATGKSPFCFQPCRWLRDCVVACV